MAETLPAVSPGNGCNAARNALNAQIRSVKTKLTNVEVKLKIAVEWLIGDLTHTHNKLEVSGGKGRATVSESPVGGKGANIDSLTSQLTAIQGELKDLYALKEQIKHY